MRTWEETCIGDGAVMACDFVICQETPDEEAESECKNFRQSFNLDLINDLSQALETI